MGAKKASDSILNLITSKPTKPFKHSFMRVCTILLLIACYNNSTIFYDVY